MVVILNLNYSHGDVSLEPKAISETFIGQKENAIVGDNQGYGRVRYIIGDRVLRVKVTQKMEQTKTKL